MAGERTGRAKWVASMAFAGVGLFGSTHARAACTMDNECPGDLICERGSCRTPAASPSAPPVAEAPAASEPRDLPPDEPRDSAVAVPAKGKRHSRGMMVGGIVLTSLAPIGLMVGGVGALESRPGVFIGGFAAAAIFAGVGIPLMVIGGRREPATTARLMPWFAPKAGGVGLVLEL